METRCVSGVLKKRPLLILCLVVCASTLVSCGGVPPYDKEPSPPSKSPSPSPPPSPPSPSQEKCVIEPDFTSTEGELRTAIFDADTKGAAKILRRDETFGLGEGLRYLPKQRCAVVRTENRRCDPDIVAFQAIALSAKLFGGADRLANSIVISFELECRCSLFNSTERDRMKKAFRDILEDETQIREILEFGGPFEDSKTCPSRLVSPIPDPRKMMTGSDRRLLQANDGRRATDSFVCAYCDPPEQCNEVVNWCPGS